MIPIRQQTKKLLIALLFTAAISLLFLSLNRGAERRLQRLQEDGFISFSHPSGFYDEAFTLEISGGGRYDIRYTLDGSEPTAASPLYERGSGIFVADVSPTANQHSARTDISAGFHSELLTKYSGGAARYTVSDEPVDKCTILRAAVFNGATRVGESVFGVYFVFPEQLEAYQKLYAVSITADPDDLFGYERGIMVTGKTMDDYFASQELSDAEHKSRWDSAYWWWWPANYRNKGVDWERTAHISVFNEDHQPELEQLCGIRIQGGGSRGRALRSLRCFARPKYAGADTFDVSFFGSDIRPDSLILFAGGDDYGFNLQDYLVHSMARELNFATMGFVPCAFFLNGEFWGVYHLTEDYNANFIANHYAVEENNILMIKNGAVEAGAEYQLQLYNDMILELARADMTIEANYRRACERIDMDSYIDYYALQTYVARYNDWPGANYAVWRTTDREDSPYGDCKWRWMLFDMNSGALAGEFYNRSAEDSVAYVLQKDETFRSLFRNADFQKRYAERLLYISEEVFDPERCAAFIDDYAGNAGTLLQQTNMRIYNNPKAENFETYTENLKLFFAERGANIREQLALHLDDAVTAELDLTTIT
ncbi:MAG: hypothetical protein E7442_01730 [Ruminococcaceae bacterium]|nr:hypothetical protein [Oscillospiraceae bacterium]